MKNQLFIAKEYLQYFWHGKNLHGIHSPFVYDFNEKVLNDNRTFYAFDKVEQLRKSLLANKTSIQVEDFGAGSNIDNSPKRRICDIAYRAGRRPKHGKLLFRLVNYFEYKNVLELGTSLGLGSAYLAQAAHQVTTIEGSMEIAKEAIKNFEQLGLKNIDVRIGKFDDLLPPILSEKQFDCIYIDGNHAYQPTLDYFELCIEHINDNGVLIFDDIHWSPQMKAAWEIIRKDPRVTVAIDLFQFGLIFKKQAIQGQELFILRY